MSKQEPTLTGEQELAYDLSLNKIIDASSGSNAPGHNPSPYIAPPEHIEQIREWKETHAWPGRFEREQSRVDDEAFE